MTAINHAVIGGIIAVVIPHPLIAIPLALASHFLLDSLPHFGTRSIKDFIKVFSVDAVLVNTFFIGLLIIRPHNWLLLGVCAFAAMSPDLMWAPGAYRTVVGHVQKQRNAILRFHKNIQRYERQWGLAIEIPWLFVFSYLLFVLEK